MEKWFNFIYLSKDKPSFAEINLKHGTKVASHFKRQSRCCIKKVSYKGDRRHGASQTGNLYFKPRIKERRRGVYHG